MFGPLEMYVELQVGILIFMISEDGQNVASRQGPKSVVEHSFGDAVRYDILFRFQVVMEHVGKFDNKSMLSWLKIQAKHMESMIGSMQECIVGEGWCSRWSSCNDK